MFFHAWKVVQGDICHSKSNYLNWFQLNHFEPFQAIEIFHWSVIQTINKNSLKKPQEISFPATVLKIKTKSTFQMSANKIFIWFHLIRSKFDLDELVCISVFVVIGVFSAIIANVFVNWFGNWSCNRLSNIPSEIFVSNTIAASTFSSCYAADGCHQQECEQEELHFFTIGVERFEENQNSDGNHSHSPLFYRPIWESLENVNWMETICVSQLSKYYVEKFYRLCDSFSTSNLYKCWPFFCNPLEINPKFILLFIH